MSYAAVSHENYLNINKNILFLKPAKNDHFKFPKIFNNLEKRKEMWTKQKRLPNKGLILGVKSSEEGDPSGLGEKALYWL